MSVTRAEILKLYKNLIVYSKSLSLTDPVYFKRKITTEFKRNKVLIDSKDIAFAYEGKHCCTVDLLFKMFGSTSIFKCARLFPPAQVVLKHTIDYSKVPTINEADLIEKFVRGGGPGGSAVNKNSNCVVLTHVPTGIVVKCHGSRCQDENRKMARQMIVARLDAALNGEESVAAQKNRIEDKKLKRSEYKRRKLAQLKSEWKKREGI